MEGIKVALRRPPLKCLFPVFYVVKTAADSVSGKGSLCPCQCGARMGVSWFIVSPGNGTGGVEGKKRDSLLLVSTIAGAVDEGVRIGLCAS